MTTLLDAAKAAQDDEPMCSSCGFPLKEYTAGLRHFGTHTAHIEWYCIQRLRGQIEQLRTAIAEAERAEPKVEPAPGWCKHCRQYTVDEPLPAEADKAEPVAWRYRPGVSRPWALTDDGYLASCKRPSYQVEELFTYPPQRESLTDEQIDAAHKTEKLAIITLMHNDTTVKEFTRALRLLARAVERAHGIGGSNE